MRRRKPEQAKRPAYDGREAFKVKGLKVCTTAIIWAGMVVGRVEREGMKCVLRNWEETDHTWLYRPHSGVLCLYPKSTESPLTCFKSGAQVTRNVPWKEPSTEYRRDYRGPSGGGQPCEEPLPWPESKRWFGPEGTGVEKQNELRDVRRQSEPDLGANWISG